MMRTINSLFLVVLTALLCCAVVLHEFNSEHLGAKIIIGAAVLSPLLLGLTGFRGVPAHMPALRAALTIIAAAAVTTVVLGAYHALLSLLCVSILCCVIADVPVRKKASK